MALSPTASTTAPAAAEAASEAATAAKALTTAAGKTALTPMVTAAAISGAVGLRLPRLVVAVAAGLRFMIKLAHLCGCRA